MNQDKAKQESSDRALVAFADQCEASNFKPSHYYRLTQQIAEARKRLAKPQASA